MQDELDFDLDHDDVDIEATIKCPRRKGCKSMLLTASKARASVDSGASTSPSHGSELSAESPTRESLHAGIGTDNKNSPNKPSSPFRFQLGRTRTARNKARKRQYYRRQEFPLFQQRQQQQQPNDEDIDDEASLLADRSRKVRFSLDSTTTVKSCGSQQDDTLQATSRNYSHHDGDRDAKLRLSDTSSTRSAGDCSGIDPAASSHKGTVAIRLPQRTSSSSKSSLDPPSSSSSSIATTTVTTTSSSVSRIDRAETLPRHARTLSSQAGLASARSTASSLSSSATQSTGTCPLHSSPASSSSSITIQTGSTSRLSQSRKRAPKTERAKGIKRPRGLGTSSLEHIDEEEDYGEISGTTTSRNRSSQPTATLEHARSHVVRVETVRRHRRLEVIRQHIVGTSPSSNSKSGTPLTATDVYALQDAGNYEMLQDEIAFLSQSILLNRRTNGSPKHYASLQAAVDLCSLLSQASKRRQILWPQAKTGMARQFFTTKSSSDASPQTQSSTIEGSGEVCSLRIILETMGKSCTWWQHRNDPETHGAAAPSDRPRSRCASQRNSHIEPMDRNDCGTTAMTGCGSSTLLLQQSLALLVFFLSQDCTLQHPQQQLSKSVARRIRQMILTHATAMQAILAMILADPLLQTLQAPQHVLMMSQGDSVVSSPRSGHALVTCPLNSFTISGTKNAEDSLASTPSSIQEDSQSTLTSFASSCSQLTAPTQRDFPNEQSPPSIASNTSHDPTIAGRNRRKRLRLDFGPSGSSKKVTNRSVLHPHNEDQETTEHGDGTSSDNLIFNAASTKRSNSSFRRETTLKTTADTETKLTFSSATSDTKSTAASKQDKMTIPLKGKGTVVAVTDTGLWTIQNKFDIISAPIIFGLSKYKNSSADHSCGLDVCPIMSSLSLISLNRIIAGKGEGADEKSCLDDLDNGGSDHSMDENDLSNNPLFLTNRWLGESGIVPLLSQALVETTTAIRHQHDLAMNGSNVCLGCIAYLHQRTAMLVSIIDNASLLHASNRGMFCEEIFTSSSRCFLIFDLAAVLMSLVDSKTIFEGMWGEIALEIVRTLTSLTHENAIAAAELAAPLPSESCCGLDVLAKILVMGCCDRRSDPSSGSDTKLKYDSIVFCLNILANVIESGGSCQSLVHTTLRDVMDSCSDDDIDMDMSLITWLTRWLVEETGSFRDAITDRDFGSSRSAHATGGLDKKDGDNLVIAGNGFVFLTCLLLDDLSSRSKNEVVDDEGNTKTKSSNSEIQDQILNEIPGNQRHRKITFLKNTLKAFCNVYRVTLGELSMAIVDPVKQLIAKLETFHDDDVESIETNESVTS